MNAAQRIHVSRIDEPARVWVDLRPADAPRQAFKERREREGQAAGVFAIASSRATHASMAHLTRAM